VNPIPYLQSGEVQHLAAGVTQVAMADDTDD
jgi:hypothetical protein